MGKKNDKFYYKMSVCTRLLFTMVKRATEKEEIVKKGEAIALVEPLLMPNPGRFVLFPIQHPDVSICDSQFLLE